MTAMPIGVRTREYWISDVRMDSNVCTESRYTCGIFEKSPTLF